MFSSLLSLDAKAATRRPLNELARLTLSEYVGSPAQHSLVDGEGADQPQGGNANEGRERTSPRVKRRVLIFDQFEEILTSDVTDQKLKEEFFDELGTTLLDPTLWAVFAMREDFVPALDPLLSRIPTRMSARMRMDLLGPRQALQAVCMLVQTGGRKFAPLRRGMTAADVLIRDLRRAPTARRATGVRPQVNPYVEPVLLQIACQRLWNSLPASTTEITRKHVRVLGRVDTALGFYYEQQVKAAAHAGQISESEVRDWFEYDLVIDGRVRGQVLSGPLKPAKPAGGSDEQDRDRREALEAANKNANIIKALLHGAIIRCDARRSALWYELSHDRLIKPIRETNLAWRAALASRANVSPLAFLGGPSPDGKLANEPPKRRSGVGLCLSGAGFRSALFHLGSLRRLNELGILSKVDTLSAVSGGSIIAAHLAEKIDRWPPPGEVVTDWERRVAAPFRAFARHNARVGATLWRVIMFAPEVYLQSVFHVRAPLGTAEILARSYESRLTRKRLADLPDRPEFVFCATDMVFGANWVFRKQRTGNFRAGFIVNDPATPGIAVAVAVAASSMPQGLGTVRFSSRGARFQGGTAPDDLKHGKLRSAIRLADGGLSDGMALEPVWKRHAFILVADGYTALQADATASFVSDFSRSADVLDAQAHAIRKSWLISNYMSGELSGAYWRIGAEDDSDGAAPHRSYSARFANDFIARIRPDVDAFSEGEAAVLENHGYALADAAIRRRAAFLIETNAPFEIPHPIWVDQKRAEHALQSSGRTYILGRRWWS